MNERFPLNHFLNIPQRQHNMPKINPFDSEGNPLSEGPPPVKSAKDAFDTEELNDIKAGIMKYLKDQINEAKYKAYFCDTFSLISLDQDKIKFTVSTEYIKTIIEGYYQTHIQDAIQQVLGKRYQIEISSLPSNKNFIFDALDKSKFSAKNASFTLDLISEEKNEFNNMGERSAHRYSENKKFKFVVDPNKSFDTFVVGPSNNMAYASALAVAKNPGKVYPCLYLHSNSGLGKTHLLHSVANKAREAYPSLAICITPARDFMTEMVDAIAKKEIQRFRKKYSEEIDILMIDDVHDLKNREGTQNEFFQVFNELHNKGKQLIFTSDKHPKDINGIEERIRTRLAWGLVLDIQPPDLETRIAILKNKAAEEDIFLPQDVLNLVASRIRSNIRELEGSLIRLAAYSSVFGIDIDMEIAKEQLNLGDNSEQSIATLETISKATSEYFKVSLSDIKSKSRLKAIAQARHVTMFLCYKLIRPTPTYMEIGLFFGGRDHTSVLHAVEKIRKASETNQALAQDLLEIENSL